MPVPKRRTSTSKRDQRRSHDALSATAAVSECPDCGEKTLRHRACPHCGLYRGRQVIEIDE